MTSKNNIRLAALERKLPSQITVLVVRRSVHPEKGTTSITVAKTGMEHIDLLPDEYEKYKDDLESLNWESL